MVEVRDFVYNNKNPSVVYFCPDCELEYGVPVELRVIYGLGKTEGKKRNRKLKNFFDIHENCGAGDLFT